MTTFATTTALLEHFQTVLAWPSDRAAIAACEVIRTALQGLDQAERAQAVAAMRVEAAGHPSGALACVKVGIDPPSTPESGDLVACGLCDHLLDLAEGEHDIAKRKELLDLALTQIALMTPLSAEVRRRRFIKHGFRPEMFDAEIRERQANLANNGNGTGPATGGAEIHNTDLGNARRLVRQHGDDLRYCFPFKSWLVWDRTRWVLDNTGEIERRARHTVAQMYTEASSKGTSAARKAMANWAKGSESRHRLNAMIDIARAEDAVPVKPDQLDADPWVLNCKNGTLDLRTGELRPHRRGDFLTKIVPVEYDENATCPKWIRFLLDVLPDPDLRAFLALAVGYSLTGITNEHCLFFAYGTGRNGKSTFFETILALLADYSHKMPTETLMVGKRTPGGASPDVARLPGTRFVVAAEVEEGRWLAESLVKDLVGGDTLTARQLYQDYIDFRPSHKLWMYGNHRPVIRGTDMAIWRRIHLIPFTVTIEADKVDRDLPQKLAAELPGILAWAARGCLDWQRSGLQVPQLVSDATSEYRRNEDEIGRFLDDCCVDDIYATVTKSDLYDAYREWGGDMSKRRFGAKLRDRGIVEDRTSGTRFWLGVGLLADDDDEVPV